jgi:KaiC/GvpD/RAD55 family RecA-like ATPase/DNA-binding response OmpR family regulator
VDAPQPFPLVASGIAPLDSRLAGFASGRPHVLSGGPGAGKSTACLEFLAAGLRRAERVALLTHDDPADVLAAGAFLGLDLGVAMREDRLVIVRYQLDFVRAFSRAAAPEEPLLELRRLFGEPVPARVAIDSVVPLLEGGGASTAAMFALVAMLDDFGATSLITYPGDLAGLYDRRLEPLMQRAAGVFHLTHSADGRPRRLETRKLRYAADSLEPIPMRITAGRGFEAVVAETTADGTRPRSIAVVDLADPSPVEMIRALERDHAVSQRSGARAAAVAVGQGSIGALLLTVRRDVVGDALRLVGQLRIASPTLPIILATQYRLRSQDRARGLRAGADDFVETSLPPDEFAARVGAIVARGRSASSEMPVATRPTPLQPTRDGKPVPMDATSFRRLLAAHLREERAPFFALVAATGTPLGPLAETAIATSRMDGGDLVAIVDDRVMVLLDGARPKDLRAWHTRFAEQAAARGVTELATETLACPGDEAALGVIAGLENAAA